MDEIEALREEWQIFKMWCPQSVKDSIETRIIEFDEYIKIVRMLDVLGFHMLREMFLSGNGKFGKEDTEARIKRIRETLTQNHYNEKPLVRIFINNISNKYIKDAFLQLLEDGYFDE